MLRESRLNRIWYEGEAPGVNLRLLAGLYRVLAALRRFMYRAGILRGQRPPVPVIVIGNLTVGGTGKTPLTLALVQAMQRRGFKPAIVSRGYGGKRGKDVLRVDADTSPQRAGDEPVLLAMRSGVPVFVHHRRFRAAQSAFAAGADLVVCDDGLQHYALARDLEIVVVDGQRGIGNARLLPAGPLREPVKRLWRADYVVVNGARRLNPDVFGASQYNMRLEAAALVNLRTGERLAPDALNGQRCAAAAGIGNPQRFFSTLAELGYSANCRAFPDHHQFQTGELDFAGELPLLLTEKDAVKCRAFARSNWWYLEVAAVLDEPLFDDIAGRLKRMSHEN